MGKRTVAVVLVMTATLVASGARAKGPPQPPQEVPTVVQRIGALASPTADIDGVDERVDVDVAILDTGIYRHHPDLNVVGSVNCTDHPGKGDKQGFGTAVAGLIGALDNDIGIVGVAPGARIWSIRVGGKRGARSRFVECGLRWVRDHADVIDVAFLAMHGLDPVPVDDPNCGGTFPREHAAICEVVDAGVPIVANGGNEKSDALYAFPGAYDEVISVSGMSDTDGLPGGLGPDDVPCLFQDEDDTFNTFSNFGADIDIAAPAACFYTTSRNGGYVRRGGLNHLATALVTGAAALYKANNPTATPEDVKAALIAAGEPGPIPGDPDAYPEPIVNVSTF